ncbi:MAG: hypothetical protein ACHQJ4_05935 [Ignavibacteria bacterium]
MRIIKDKPEFMADSLELYLTMDEVKDFRDLLNSNSRPTMNTTDAGNIIGEENDDGFNIKPNFFNFDFFVYGEKNFNDFTKKSKIIILEDRYEDLP